MQRVIGHDSAATASGVDRAAGDEERDGLLALAATLRAQAYRFTTPTPATHGRYLAATGRRRAQDLRDVFGWTMAFDPGLLDAELLCRLESAGLIERDGGACKSRVRAATLDGHIVFHSAYPTDDKDAVFFGPDSYRFAALIARAFERWRPAAGARLIDIGTGTGIGAIVAAGLQPGLDIVMTDVNPRALRLAAINCAIAGVAARPHLGDGLSGVDGKADIVLANPPYMVDEAGRSYRDGGTLHGGALALRMAEEAVSRLGAGGRLILYGGSAIVAGEDRLQAGLARIAAAGGCTLEYDEIDPDVFGEELERPAYRGVERIAAVGAIIARP